MIRKKSFILALILLLALSVFAFGCEETTTPERVEKDDTEQVVTTDRKSGSSDETAAPATETFSIGDTVKMGDLEFTLKGARWDQGDQFMKPDQGERWLVLDCEIENRSDKSTSISSLLMFTLYDEDNYSMDMEFFANTKGSLDGELGAGRKMAGELAFNVEEGQSTWEFIFEPNVFGFGQAIYVIAEDEVK